MCVVAAFSFGTVGLLNDLEKKAELRYQAEARPPMTRVGVVEVDGAILHLWTFEFEGKQCLWATRYRHSGLTCDWGEKTNDE